MSGTLTYDTMTHEARELTLYIENNEPMYNYLANSEQRSAQRHASVLYKGATVDAHDIAGLLGRFVRVANRAKYAYVHEFRGTSSFKFKKSDETECATFLMQDFLDRMVSGEGPTESTRS